MGVIYDDFKDRHAIVTGAGAGIGRAIAVALAAQGARVSAIDINQDGLLQTAARSEHITAMPCDLTNPDALRATVTAALRARGKVRCLINNAGVDRRIPFLQTTAEDWHWMLTVNLDHQMLVSQLVAPEMDLSDDHAAIVNMSSSAWMKLAGNLAAYHTAKAGIIGLTRGLARDLGGAGITVNAIAPGRVMTERVAETTTEAWEAETKTLQCVPKLITPKDIAGAAVWLSSSAASTVTGQTLIIDGGVV
ncbi:SDR family NAD(P)-dependent oxidoreductase [Pseudoruegeria sp. SK021]|uniref:SDR family NAD(P)-dependent oxidoreductase n=1 Tax=Pseudoruegeria sp. SK021 TaxID=1933035 RepID=UPI000A2667DE|nr:SDR family oxidoreductase [Pseudoruegeria sp. SK021]OSP55781.1 hypothetical protein BV911_05190 [Pseudoruegeria sp. SK021]